MTHKENITAILECYFPGHKEEIIESACNRILEQELTTKDDLGVDAVNREELLKIYEGRFLELQKLKHLKDNKGAEDRQMGINYCINILEEMPPVTLQPKMGQWIPVSERLPYNHEYIQNNGLFIVSDGNRSYSEWFDIYDTQKFGKPTMNGFRVDYAVTAWMPLPKAYKKEDD